MADKPIDLAAAREQTLEAILKEYPPLLTSAHVAELMQCTIWRCATKSTEVSCRPSVGVSSSVSSARRFSRCCLTGLPVPTRMSEVSEESPQITYEKWYPDLPPVMDSQELADLLSASDQVIRTWAREGVIPSHRAPGARKFKFLRHEIFEWLVENRYDPQDDNQTST